MLSAKEAKKITTDNKDYVERQHRRMVKTLLAKIEWRIKNAASHGESYVGIGVSKEFESDIISCLKEAGYKVKIDKSCYVGSGIKVEW